MALRTKLLIFFLIVGLVPFTVANVISLFVSNSQLTKQAFSQLSGARDAKAFEMDQFFSDIKGNAEILSETINTLRNEARDKLVAIRKTKQYAVERYFQTISDQMTTFSRNRMIVDAMSEFRDAFNTYDNEVNESQGALLNDAMRTRLSQYYTGAFSTEYGMRNNGESPGAARFFSQIDGDSVSLQYQYIATNPNPLGYKHHLDGVDDGSRYSRTHAKIHPIIRDYLEKFEYYDIFLADPDTGDIVYSVFKEIDYTTSLIDGPFAQTNFGEAFRRANALDDPEGVVLVDYEPYIPSYNDPASFIASPIYDGDNKVGIAIFQMPIDRLNYIMGERAGLGKTGETYLVGSDLLMRSDSYLDPDGHSVIGSFRNPDSGMVDTEAAKAAIAGKTDVRTIVDYNGNLVLSAYTPVTVGELRWALLAEIDIAEAFCPVNDNGEYYFARYAEMHGYHDLYLVNGDGYCFYTVLNGVDNHTNLVNGKYKDSGLGKLARRTLRTQSYGMADFMPYAPDNNKPAFFAAQPLIHDGKVEIIAVIRVSIDAINSIMHDDNSGAYETYLVGRDLLMRSDSVSDAGYTVSASFAGTMGGRVNTEAVSMALSGKRGHIAADDYGGEPSFTAFTPLSVGDDIQWALIADIGAADALAPYRRSLLLVIYCIIPIILLTILMCYLGTHGIATAIGSLLRLVKETTERSNASAAEISYAVAHQTTTTEEQSSSITEIATMVEEYSMSTAAVTENIREVMDVSENAYRDAENGVASGNMSNDSIKVVKVGNQGLIAEITDLRGRSREITGVTEIINDIANQTRLIAFNASIEASSAGDAGKRFGVVADEIRRLADSVTESAAAIGDKVDHIQAAIERLIDNTQKGSKRIDDGMDASARSIAALSTILDGMDKTRQAAKMIHTAAQQQEIAHDQILKAVREVSDGAVLAANSIEQIKASTVQSARVMDRLSTQVGEFATQVGVAASKEEASQDAKADAAAGEVSGEGRSA